MVRHPSTDNNNNSLKKGTWSPEEDQKLIAYIRRYGIWNWTQMARPAGLARTGKSCRLRWMNYLRPNIRHGNITKEEEEIIIKLHRVLGNRWAAIAARLHGRTDNEIKNYWNTRLKKRFLKSQTVMTPEIKVDSYNSQASFAVGDDKNIDQSEGDEHVSKQFLALKDLDVVDQFKGMRIESGAPIHPFGCIQPELVFSVESYDDFIIDLWAN